MDCRICLESNNQETMISPCRCSGTSRWVHRECIERWIQECENIQARKKCMECHHQYEYEYTEDTKLIERFKIFKENFSIIANLSGSVVVVFAFLIFTMDGPDEDTHFIQTIYLQVVYFVWLLINLVIEFLALYYSCKDNQAKFYLKKSLLPRLSFVIFGYILIYFIIIFWHFIFGLIIMYFFKRLH